MPKNNNNARKISVNTRPYHAASPVTVADVTHAACFHANTSKDATENAARFTNKDAEKLRRRAPLDLSAYRTYTCASCAVRKKCSSFCATRTAKCSGKVEPLPPITSADLRRMYTK